MSSAAFRQADMERIIRAAKRTGGIVQIDIRNLVVTVRHEANASGGVDSDSGLPRILPLGNLAPDGKDNFDED